MIWHRRRARRHSRSRARRLLAQSLPDGRRHVGAHVAGAQLSQRVRAPESQGALIRPQMTAVVDVVNPQRRLCMRKRRNDCVRQDDGLGNSTHLAFAGHRLTRRTPKPLPNAIDELSLRGESPYRKEHGRGRAGHGWRARLCHVHSPGRGMDAENVQSRLAPNHHSKPREMVTVAKRRYGEVDTLRAAGGRRRHNVAPHGGYWTI